MNGGITWVHEVNVRIPSTHKPMKTQGARMAEIRVENKSVCLCCGTETSIDNFFV